MQTIAAPCRVKLRKRCAEELTAWFIVQHPVVQPLRKVTSFPFYSKVSLTKLTGWIAVMIASHANH